MQKLQAKKTVNTQAIIDLLNGGFCFKNMKQVFVINEHPSSPDQKGFQVYQDLNGLYLNLMFKGKGKTCAACTVSQFPSVSKRSPINTIRIGRDGASVHTQSLFAYNADFDVKVSLTNDVPDFYDSGLTKEEYALFSDWINFRLGNPTSSLTHKRGLGIVRLNVILKLAETYLNYEITKSSTKYAG